MNLKFKGWTIAIMAFIVGTGVAYGLPQSTTLSSAHLKQDNASSKADRSNRSPGSEGAEPTQSPDPESSSGDDPSKPEHDHGVHGAAVSSAAHCAVKGSAHGALVSSVALRSAVTVAQAKAACAAAKAPGTTAHGRSAQARQSSHGKSDDDHGENASAQSKGDPSKE